MRDTFQRTAWLCLLLGSAADAATFSNSFGSATISPCTLSRNDAVGKGERDRPGRSVRCLAEQLVRQVPLTVWCVIASAANPSAGRRRERSRRPRSHLQLRGSGL